MGLFSSLLIWAYLISWAYLAHCSIVLLTQGTCYSSASLPVNLNCRNLSLKEFAMHLAVYLVAILSIGFGNGSLMPPPIDHHEHLKFEANTQDTRADDEWRLPQDVLPVSYNVRLLPFFEDRNFLTQGHVEIIVNCVQATSSITFNYLDMTIDRQSITVT